MNIYEIEMWKIEAADLNLARAYRDRLASEVIEEAHYSFGDEIDSEPVPEMVEKICCLGPGCWGALRELKEARIISQWVLLLEKLEAAVKRVAHLEQHEYRRRFTPLALCSVAG